jgi:uncharacterized protein (TIGR00255 family)
MINSMTGYGKGEVSGTAGRISVEIRSVNHRYGEIYVKLPRGLLQFEQEVRKAVADRLKRGKIEVFVQLDESSGAAGQPLLNLPLARAYHAAFTELKEALALVEPVTLALLTAQKDILASREDAVPDEEMAAALRDALGKALDQVAGMRGREGKALHGELHARMTALLALVERVAARAPLVVRSGAEKLQERLAKLLTDGTIDENRLAQEVAILADRSDITEELVRLQSHQQQFFTTLELSEPVGRKLDFLLQEVNREVNTIGSKANDGEIAMLVVELKAELEKIREQVQNIE